MVTHQAHSLKTSQSSDNTLGPFRPIKYSDLFNKPQPQGDGDAGPFHPLSLLAPRQDT